MTNFIIHFLICNGILTLLSGLLIIMKHFFKKYLTSRLQYLIDFLFMILLLIPLIPISFNKILPPLSLFREFFTTTTIQTTNQTAYTVSVQLTDPSTSVSIQDFAVSIEQTIPSFISILIFFLWILGILLLTVKTIRAYSQLYKIRRFARPVSNWNICEIYKSCLSKLHITKDIPLCSTDFFLPPSLVGWRHPYILLPQHMISDSAFEKNEWYHVFIHELQHYKHKDNYINILITFTNTIYWCNPAIKAVLKNIQYDRETACDSSVLQLLEESEYLEYGNTLIRIAEKMAHQTAPFISGISSTMKQLQGRIIHISSYQKPSGKKKKCGSLILILTTLLFFSFIPLLNINTSFDSYYNDVILAQDIYTIDLADNFKNCTGTFVLYERNSDSMYIYNEKLARTRVSPASTYKIYDALLALEQNIITENNSSLTWDGTSQPFKLWEKDQDLSSAMHNSVNWYFQTLDAQLGAQTISVYLNDINYGNKTIGSNTSTYWGDGSLKISPLEQTILLQQFCNEKLPAKAENVNTVKDSLYTEKIPIGSSAGKLYGKTGTTRFQDESINGWFIGFVETTDNVYYFATYLKGESNITGSKAAEVTRNIFSSYLPNRY